MTRKGNRRIGGYATQLSLNENELSLVQKARRNIDKAYSIAGTDEEKKRIDLLSQGFKISEDFFEMYNSKIVDSNKVNELKNYLKNTVAGNQMMLNMATDKDFTEKMNTLIDQIIKMKK